MRWYAVGSYEAIHKLKTQGIPKQFEPCECIPVAALTNPDKVTFYDEEAWEERTKRPKLMTLK